MKRGQRRQARAAAIRAARFHEMWRMMRRLCGRGLFVSHRGAGGGFAVMETSHSGRVMHWECGGIRLSGEWSGGTDRLRQAVEAFWPVMEETRRSCRG